MTDRAKTSTQAAPGRTVNNAFEQNKAVVRQFIEGALNRVRQGEWEHAFANEAVMFHPTRREPVRGLPGIRKVVDEFHRAFPDFRVRTVQMVAEGNEVAFMLECQGTFQGEFAGFQPNNKQFHWFAANFATIRDGKIVDLRVCDNFAHHFKG